MPEAIAITRWKEKMYETMKAYYGSDVLDRSKCMDFLDSEIKKNINNRKITLINNYTNVVGKSDILSLVDLIYKNNLIIGGGGVLYYQHSARDNPLIDFIIHIMAERKRWKGERKKYDKSSDEWLMADINQLNKKISINSLYGCMGYSGFILYNIFNAEAITNQGRQIISSAAECFEFFAGDNLSFSSEEELFEYMSNIHNEYKCNYKDMNISKFDIATIKNNIYNRFLSLCVFDYNDAFPDVLHQILSNKSDIELVILYYKNNLVEFNKNQFIKDKYKYLMDNISELTVPELSAINNPECRQMAEDIWDFYRVFVLYDYPIYDRVRKNMYTDKKIIVAEDTDSNFICLNKFIKYIENDVMHNIYNKPENEVQFIAVNLLTCFLSRVVDCALQTLCKYMNVTKEYSVKLAMKNEFYLSRMLFTNKKKRYISNSILQEGQLLNNGEGLPEIKGFDFKKSTVKPFVNDYFTNICQDDILKAQTIDVEKIFKKLMALRGDIEESMRKGESKYFKQANVQLAEHYKKPYSSQGFTSILLWNALNPEYAMDLPTDVDIIPIKDLRNKKNMDWFINAYPDAYSRLEKNILNNNNVELSKIGLKYIAKPKNNDIPLPAWFGDLVDTEKVVSDTLSLFYPIMESLGLKVLKTTSTSTHLSNMVDL